jgi:hypothetical protein
MFKIKMAEIICPDELEYRHKINENVTTRCSPLQVGKLSCWQKGISRERLPGVCQAWPLYGLAFL